MIAAFLNWLLTYAAFGFAVFAGFGIGCWYKDAAEDRRHPKPTAVKNVGYSLNCGQIFISAHSDLHAANELIASLSGAPPSTGGGR